MSQSPKPSQSHDQPTASSPDNAKPETTNVEDSNLSHDQTNQSQTSFEGDEDNNPFLHHQGLSSFSHLHLNNSHKEQTQNEGASPLDDVDESMLLYKSSKLDRLNNNSESFNTVNMNFESRVTKLLKPKVSVKIQITEAGNSNEGMTNSLKKYIVYTIKLVNVDNRNDEVLTRRRYSDFESLRDVLTKIFPLVIIPPIPPKNYFDFSLFNGFVGQGSIGFGSNNGITGSTTQERSMGNGGVVSSAPSSATPTKVNVNNNHTTVSTTNNLTSPSSSYAYINSTHLAKNKLIEHRKRLLSNFLNNCLEIKQIRQLEFFHKFLDPNANWSDEIALIHSQLPKSIYLLNPENGLKTDAIYANLPNPSSSKSTIDRKSVV